MEYPKKRPEGQLERKKVLTSIYPQTAEAMAHTLSTFKRKEVARDDILDALSIAVTAMMGRQRLISIPQTPELDDRGLCMEMVYCLIEN